MQPNYTWPILGFGGNVLIAIEQNTPLLAKTKGAHDSEIYMEKTSPLLQTLLPTSLFMVQDSKHHLPRL